MFKPEPNPISTTVPNSPAVTCSLPTPQLGGATRSVDETWQHVLSIETHGFTSGAIINQAYWALSEAL